MTIGMGRSGLGAVAAALGGNPSAQCNYSSINSLAGSAKLDAASAYKKLTGCDYFNQGKRGGYRRKTRSKNQRRKSRKTRR